MSYLTPPRLTFSGTSYANASTANNNDIANVYDIDNMVINPSMDLMTGGHVAPQPPLPDPFLWAGAADNPALRTWLMGLMTAPGVDNVGTAQMAHWNYYGDYDTKFPTAGVTDAVTGSGAASMTDKIRGLQVELLGNVFYGRRRGGVLVDIDPYALVTSQIICGRFQLSYKVSETVTLPVLIGDNPTISYSYFINPNKNLNPTCIGFEGVSAVFQFGLPLASLQFPDAGDFASSAFAELRSSLQGAKGLMVRYCLYDAKFDIKAGDLNKAFTQGDYISNPYVGRVLGSIGLWNDGELASAPPGRKLRVQSPFTYKPPAKELSDAEFAVKKAGMASVAKYRERRKAASAGDELKQATLGVALANVDTANSIVTLDCISTFPEANTANRDKFDLGPINLVLLYGTPQRAIVIGPVPNDKATYESGGGVVEVSYANNPDLSTINANIATGQLALYTANTATSLAVNLLTETPGFDVQTDNRGLYFDFKVGEGANAVPGTGQITIQVMKNGVPPAGPVTLNLEYWMCSKTFVNPDKPQVPVTDRYFTVAGATPAAPTSYTLGYLAGMKILPPPGNVTVMTDQIQVPAGGQLTLNLTAARPGVSIIRFVDPSIQPPPAPNFGWDNCDYATVRILPFDDYSGYTDEQINNWSFIYDNFFGFYSVLYPVMSTVVPWGPDGAPNNPADVKNFAQQMLMLTDPAMWMSTIYMPITRDLSGGKRELLRRWCVLQQSS